MQARPKIVQIFVVALIISLVLGACGGGTTGKTWFNLPSVPVNVQADGTASVLGFNVGYIGLAPAMIQQMQAVPIQELEVRIGYNGVHVYANGEDLPYLKWDQASVETLQGVLPKLPQLGANGQTIANALPWLRTIGLGVKLKLPVAAGGSKLDIPNWNGETAITTAPAGEPTLGPITIGSLAFDPSGAASIEGVPVSVLEQALGASIPLALPPDVLALIQGLGADSAQVKIQPNGIDLALGDKALPGVAWDGQRLDALGKYLPAFVADPALLGTINQALPLLKGADVTVAVSFTGEQSAATSLAPIEVTLTDDGSVQLFGIPVLPAAVPADVMSNLQAANVQQLAVSLQPTGLYLAANGQTLPTITWTDTSLDTVVQVAGVLMGNEQMLKSILDIALGIGPNLKVNVPPAAGAAALEIPDNADFAISPTEADPQAPVVHLRLGVDAQGNVTQLGDFSAAEISQLGVTLPALPLDSVNRLRDAGIKEVNIDTDPGVLHVLFDGNNILDLNYDQAALAETMQLAAPFATGTLLADPGLSDLLNNEIVPLFPAADINLTVSLN